jgi:hypothetical protein
MAHDQLDKLLADMNSDFDDALKENVPQQATYQHEPAGVAVDRLAAMAEDLRQRLRNQRMVAHHTYEARCADAQRQFEYDMNDAITRLERERDTALKALRDDFAREINEIDAAASRLP